MNLIPIGRPPIEETDHNMNRKIEFESISWETASPGIRHKAVIQGHHKIRLVEYSSAMEPHWCENGHYGVILEGRMEISFENETLMFGPGDGVFIPSGKKDRHKGRVLTDKVRALFVEEI